MAYVSLYRKWRPQSFTDVIGQNHVTRTLQNALEMGRIGHAYLFSGPRGTGKTTVAKLLAKALNCQDGTSSQPCDQCDNCRQIREGVSMDVVEIDGASNRGIDEIRDLREKVRFVPSQGRYKIYIIDEVHMLTTEAFNALLKTLEEPPGHAIFVFATTEPHKVPATIVSRCQSFEFHRIGLPDLASRLEQVSTAENLKVSESALNLIARNAQGGLRDALSILDQCIAFAGDEISVDAVKELLGVVEFDLLAELTGALLKGNVAGALIAIEQVISLGKDLTQFTSALLEYWRDMMIYKASEVETQEYTPEEITVLIEQTGLVDLSRLTGMLEVLGEALPEVRRYQSKLPLELAAVKIGAALVGTVMPTQQVSKPQTAQRLPEQPKPEQQPPVYVSEPNEPEDTRDEVPRWSEFLTFLKDKGLISIQGILRDARTTLSQGKLWLLFKENMTFHRDHINMQENRKNLEGALAEFYNERWEVEAICGRLPQSSEQQIPQGDNIEDDPVVQKAYELFGPSVVRIEDN